MAQRDNHYECAFEAFLRQRQIPYVAVDEARRALGEEGSLKSLDFIVAPRNGATWLVDVKGRRFPSGEQKQYWKNWSTRDDLVSLAAWERQFGEGCTGLFVFAFNVIGDRAPLPVNELFEFRGALYAFLGVTLKIYAQHARPISPAWDTWAMSALDFRAAAVSVVDLFGGSPNAETNSATPATERVTHSLAIPSR